MLKKKASVKASKGVLYMTDILDSYAEGYMQKIQASKDDTRTVFYVFHGADRYVLKVVTCPLAETETVEQARNECALAEKMSSLTPHVAKLIKVEEKADKGIGYVYIESLYEYAGDSLLSLIGKVEAQEIFEIAQKTLEPLAIMEQNSVFHSDLKPSNILYSEGRIKLIDFGGAKDFETRTKLIQLTDHLTGKMTECTKVYCPPEVLNRVGKYSLGKIDVYCWGMTIYRLISGSSIEDMETDICLYKGPETKYEGFIEKIRSTVLKGDPEGRVTKWLIPVLIEALDKDPEKRPTFTELKKQFYEAGVESYETLRKLLKTARDERDFAVKNCEKLAEEVKAWKVQCEEAKMQIDSIEVKLKMESEQKKNLEERCKTLAGEKARYEKSANDMVTNLKREIEELKKRILEQRLVDKGKPGTIRIKTLAGREFHFEVDLANDTLGKVKELFYMKSGMLKDEQKIIFAGESLSNDSKTLASYDIENGSTIYCVPLLRDGMQIFVRFLNGKQTTLDTKLKDSISEIKQKIYSKTGLYPKEQKLIFAGESLEDDKTLEDYDIIQGVTLYVVSQTAS